MSRQKMSVEMKVEREFPDFAVEVARMSVDDLNKRLLTYTKSAEEIDQSKENDEKLANAKDTAKEMAAPYRDAKKAVSMKMKYIMNRIKEMGGQ